MCFFFSSRRRHTRWTGDWSSDVCSSDLRLVETCAQEAGIAPLGQMLSARDLLRRPAVTYEQVAQLARLVGSERGELISDPALPVLPAETAEEVELQVKYENYVRKQEQMVHRTLRLEEMRIPETLDKIGRAHV